MFKPAFDEGMDACVGEGRRDGRGGIEDRIKISFKCISCPKDRRVLHVRAMSYCGLIHLTKLIFHYIHCD